MATRFWKGERRASGLYESSNTTLQEVLEKEAEMAIFEEEERAAYEAYLQSSKIEWTAGSGQQIKVECQDNLRSRSFKVSVNGRFLGRYEVDEIKAAQVAGKPEIVAKIGPVGLTAERRDALLEMAGIKKVSVVKRPRIKKKVSPAVAAMQIPEGKKARLVRGKLVVK